MIEEQKEEQACLYALGALSTHETLEFEQELTNDPELQQFLGELQPNLQALALSAPLHFPAPELKEKVLGQFPALHWSAKADSRPGQSIDSGGFPYWLPWSLAACLGVVCIVFLTQTQWTRQSAESLQPRIDELRKELEKSQHQIASLKNRQDASQFRVVVLRSLVENSPKCLAVFLWDTANGKALFTAEGMASLPANREYHLWLLDKQNNPISGGTFNADQSGRARFQFTLPSPANFVKFAVTVEPKGGGPKPSGPVILLGQSTL